MVKKQIGILQLDFRFRTRQMAEVCISTDCCFLVLFVNIADYEVHAHVQTILYTFLTASFFSCSLLILTSTCKSTDDFLTFNMNRQSYRYTDQETDKQVEQRHNHPTVQRWQRFAIWKHDWLFKFSNFFFSCVKGDFWWYIYLAPIFDSSWMADSWPVSVSVSV